MAVKKLKAVALRPSDFDAIEQMILKFFRDEIYLPIFKELKVSKKSITNSSFDIHDAIRSGKIFYSGNSFYGDFSSKTSKALKDLGAKWEAEKKRWKLPISKIPKDLRASILFSKETFNQTLKRISDKINKITPEMVSEKIDLTKHFDALLYKTEMQVSDSMRNLAVEPTLSTQTRLRIAKEYNQNLDLYIRKFLQEETEKLRTVVQESTFQGVRYESLVGKIKDSYGVSERKAKFLARQETNLLLAKYKESKYTEAGIDRYEWRCVVGSPNHPVRPMHKIHNGKIFAWNNPPIVDEQGNRKNPGEDYNCRCVAVPVIEV